MSASVATTTRPVASVRRTARSGLSAQHAAKLAMPMATKRSSIVGVSSPIVTFRRSVSVKVRPIMPCGGGERLLANTASCL